MKNFTEALELWSREEIIKRYEDILELLEEVEWVKYG